jgi:hypothetical protein
MSVTVTSSKRLTQLRSADAIVSGSVTANSFVGALTGNASTATTAATVTTAAQPSITSVGTLTTLNVSGNITASGNISASGTGSFGRVGIGTASPTSLLTVGGSGVDGSFKVQASTNSSWFSVASGTVIFNDQGGSTKAGGIDLGARFNIAPVNDSIPTLAVRGFSGGVSDIVRISSPSVTTGDYMIVKSTGNVGIGTTSPGYKLSVAGTIQSNAGTITGYPLLEQLRMTYDQDGNYWKFETTAGPGADLLISQNATPFLVVKSGTGRVGIGTTSPGSKLQVYTGNTANANDGITLMRGAGLDVFGIKHRSDAGGIYRGAITYDAAEVMTFLSAGNVGIGTTSPTAKLHVVGDALITGKITAQEFHTEFVSASIIYQSGSTKFGDTSDDVHSFSGSLRVTGSGDHYFTDGNVGIGTASPTTRLEVIGDIKIKQNSTYANYSLIDASEALLTLSTFSVNSSTYPADIKFSPNQTERMRITSAGNGIGTTDPTAKLHVAGNIWASGSSGHITASGNISASGTLNVSTFASIQDVDTGNPTPAADETRVSGYGIIGNRPAYYITNANAGSLIFGVGGAHAAATKMTILNSGNVGIGTDSPGEKLEVVGNISASGTITANSFVGALTGNASTATLAETANEATTAATATKIDSITNSDIVQLASFQTLSNKTFSGGATFNGSTSGGTKLKATAVAGLTTLTLPAATDTLVGKATTDTLTNKTIDGDLNTITNVALTTGVTGTLPASNGGTGITSLGTGVATFLGTPSSANLRSAVTGDTGTGDLVFATSPTLTTPVLGTPSSGDLTNCTFPTLNQNTTGNAATADYAETANEATTAATLATARTIGGVSFNGSANIPQRQITHHSATFTFAVNTKQYIGLLDSDSESTTVSNINLPFLAPSSGKLLKIFLRSSNNLIGGDLTLLLEKNALDVNAGGTPTPVATNPAAQPGPSNSTMKTYEWTSPSNTIDAGDMIFISIASDTVFTSVKIFFTCLWEWDY